MGIEEQKIVKSRYYYLALYNRGSIGHHLAQLMPGDAKRQCYQLAINDLSEIIQMKKFNQVGCYQTLGDIYAELGDLKQARLNYELALDQLPALDLLHQMDITQGQQVKYASIMANLGAILGNLAMQFPNEGYEFKALGHLAYATQLNQDDFHHRINYGYALLRIKQYELALAEFSYAPQLQDQATAHEGKGLALMALTRLDEAISAFTRAIELAPNYVNNWLNRGRILKLLNRLEEALTDFKTCLRLEPKQIEAKNLAEETSSLLQEKALRKAANDGNLAKLKSLINDGKVDVNSAGPDTGKTALHWAVSARHSDCVALLLNAKAKPRKADHKGKTPLAIASEQSDKDILALFPK